MTSAAEGAPLISARGLKRVYMAGDVPVTAIDGIDLRVAPAELVVLKGESGSGKSTLLSLLAGLDRPSAGEITVAGHDLGRAGERELTEYRRHVVGIVFQSFNLLPTLKVEENVCLPALLAGRTQQAVRAKAGELLDWLGLAHRRGHLPGQLSGGEMQRVAIARALINAPPLVLADEPTGNLDSRNSRIVVDLLASLHRTFGCTVVIATHSRLADDLATLALCLQDGKWTDAPCAN